MLSHIVKRTLPKTLILAVFYELSVRLGQWMGFNIWLWPLVFAALIIVGAVLLTVIEHSFWHWQSKRYWRKHGEQETAYATDEA